MAGDELFEMFTWLPAKTLHKFAAVAKPCLGFLSDPHFIEKQCANSEFDTEESFFMYVDTLQHLRANNPNLLFGALSQNEGATSMGLPPQSLTFLATTSYILASSNGLLLCRYDSKPPELLLCNPITRTCLPISLPSSCTEEISKYNWDLDVVLVCGSGNFCNNKFPLDYSLLLFDTDISKPWSNYRNVYVFEDGKWILKSDNFNTGGRDLDFTHPVLSSNGLYFMSDCADCVASWASYYLPYVLYYDVFMGTTRKIALPSEACENNQFGQMRIFGWDAFEGKKSCFKSISLVKFRASNFLVWVLEDTEDPNSWYKLVDIEITKDLDIKDPYSFSVGYIIMGKKLVFATNLQVYSYGLVGEERGVLQVICKNNHGTSWVRFVRFGSTLRPCQNDVMASTSSI